MEIVLTFDFRKNNFLELFPINDETLALPVDAALAQIKVTEKAIKSVLAAGPDPPHHRAVRAETENSHHSLHSSPPPRPHLEQEKGGPWFAGHTFSLARHLGHLGTVSWVRGGVGGVMSNLHTRGCTTNCISKPLVSFAFTAQRVSLAL